MFKRITCIFMVLSMALGLMCVNASSKVPSADETGLDVLKGLEIVCEYENDSKLLDKMSKSTYINFLLNMMYGGKFGAAYDEDALSMAEELKIIDSSSSVLETDILSGEEAVKMSMCLLGYREICLKMGGYPFGFMQKANQIGLLQGLSIKDEMTNGDAYRLLYNTMDMGVVDVEAVGVHGDEYVNYYSQYDDVTILNIYRDIYKVEGVVDANHTTGIFEPDGAAEDCVRIDGKQLGDPSGVLYDSLGYRVCAFVQEKSDGKYDIVCAEIDEKNSVTQFSTKNVENVSPNVRDIEYYPDDDSSKTKKATIKASASLLFNNTVYSDYTAEDFKASNGNVTLIDNDGDKIIDVIKLDVYKVMVVASVSGASKVVNNEYQYTGALKKLDLSLYNDSCDSVRFFMDDKAAAFEDIQNGDVLSVFESKGTGNKSIDVYITKDKNIVTVTACNSSENEITAGDVIYELSDTYCAARTAKEGYAQELLAGRKYEIYLDRDGRIVAAKTVAEDGLGYGYLKTVEEIEKAFQPDFAMRIFGDDGIWKNLYFADKVRVNEASGLTAKSAKEQVQAFVGDVIGYELNKDGKINHIELPVEIETDILDKNSVENSDDRLIKTGERSRTYYYNNTSFESYHYMTADTRVIFIPSEELENESLYDVGNNYSFTRTTVNYVGYGCDEYGFLDIVLVKRGTSLSKKPGNQLYFVRDIGEALDGDGNITSQITVASSVYFGLSMAVEDKALLENVKQGDIIKVHVNANGNIDNIEHIFDISPESGDVFVKEILGDINSGSGQVKGVLTKADFSRERMLIESSRVIALKAAASVPVLIYEADSNTVTSGTVNDVTVDDYVVVQISDAKVTGLYVVRDVK